MTEPILRPSDLRAWDTWRITALHHARTQRYARAVDAARAAVEHGMRAAAAPVVMWSGGKDSTVMTHLICVDRGIANPVVSEKDDLDYPGEEQYVGSLGNAWDLDLRIVRPEISPSAWLDAHAGELDAGADLHSRAAAMAKRCFYDVIEAATVDYDCVFLGLRADESAGRQVDLATRGTLYRYRSGKLKCQPIGGWTGLDVMAYLLSRDIEPLHVYRCIAFMHAREPWRIRKSWWIPEGTWSAPRGGVAWLRHYYPSLYARLLSWMPAAKMLT